MNNPQFLALFNYRIWGALLLAASLGCGEQVEKTTVTGIVSYREKPITGGVVNFFPGGGGQPIPATIDQEGHYEILLPADSYSVAIQSSPKYPEGFKEGDPLPPPDPKALPPRFSLKNKSGLTAAIEKQSEPQVVDFALK